MNDKHSQVIELVGKDLADQLEYAISTGSFSSYDRGQVRIVGEEDFPTVGALAKITLSAFECERCGAGYHADPVAERGIKCPGCGSWASYEQLQSAILELKHWLEIDETLQVLGPSGSSYNLELLGYGISTGTIMRSQAIAAASWQGANRLVGSQDICRIDNMAPAVGNTGLCKCHGGKAELTNWR